MNKFNKKKKIILMLSLFNIVSLTSCSIGGIKVIERTNATQNTESEQNETIEHAGLTFNKKEFNMVASNDTVAKKSLEEGQDEVAFELKKGEEIKILGKDTTDKYAVGQKEDAFGYIEIKDLSSLEKDENESQNKETQTKDNDSKDKKVEEKADNSNSDKELVTEDKPEKEIVEIPKDESLGIEYPAAPDSTDFYDGVSFAILTDINAEVAIPVDMFKTSLAQSEEIANLEQGDQVKVLAIGTNNFARIETEDGKVGFVNANTLRKK